MLQDYTLLFSLYIYTITCIVMTGLAGIGAQISSNSNHIQLQKNCIIILISLVFGLVFGMRWNVGVDYLAYLDAYINNNTERFEYLFKYINDTLPKLGVHYALYFSAFAFCQVFLLLYALKKQSYIWPFIIISLFGGVFFWDWMNVMRQEMASCIMFFSINSIIEKKIWKFLICLIIAFGFHSSAIIWIIVLPFIYNGKSYIPNVYIQALCIIIAAFLVFINFDILSRVFPILDSIQNLGILADYGVYSESVLLEFKDKTKLGFLFISFVLINLIIIYNYKHLKQSFNSKRFIIYYNLYFWGTVFEMIVATNLVLARPFRYFRIYKLVIIAYLLYYLYNRNDMVSKICFIFILVLFALCLLSISMNSPFNFFFEISYAP